MTHITHMKLSSFPSDYKNNFKKNKKKTTTFEDIQQVENYQN